MGGEGRERPLESGKKTRPNKKRKSFALVEESKVPGPGRPSQMERRFWWGEGVLASLDETEKGLGGQDQVQNDKGGDQYFPGKTG